jgi:ornithine carbamoyltransferase
MGRSLLETGAMLGMDVRIVAPKDLWPDADFIDKHKTRAAQTSARVTVTEDIEQGVKGADFLHTDVWVSMGESHDVWGQRIKLLQPYQINAETMRRTGNPNAKFMHCLPAFHNRETKVGEEIYEHFGIDCMEVSEEVFESPASIVFDQAENRMHTIKAILVATLAA